MISRRSGGHGSPGQAVVATGPSSGGRARLMGWKREALIFGLAYVLYELTRGFATGGYDAALENARRVVAVQGLLHLNIEAAVQRAVHNTPILEIFNLVYLIAQPIVIPIVIVWCYRRSQRVYRVLRDTLITTWLIALPVYALFPTAPPRLSGVGLTDTVSAQSGVALDSHFTTLFYNPYAAMPSLHSAFAVSIGIAAAVVSRHWWSKVLWSLWGPTVIMATIATGNHFWLDALSGITVASMGLLISAYVVRGGRIWGSPELDPPRRTATATAGARAVGG